jgi:hypothetical protein
MMNFKYFAAALAVTTVCYSGCGAGAVGNVSGQVSIDGVPAETGAVSFRPADSPTSRGAGAAINAGQFQLAADHGLKPGKYLVSAEVSKATGKTFNDPQKGPVPVMQSVALADSPQEVEITSDNGDELQIAFSTKAK